MPYDGSLWLKTLSLLDIIKDNAGSKRVFLTRAKNAGRYISNFDEILPMLNEYKFEIYDTNDMPFEEQVVLFSKIKYLISIHGAGETNICFSYKNNLSMLEINPGNRIACQYYWMANMLNYKYNVIMGNNLESLDKRNEGGFYLSPEKFRNALEKMFNERN
jgi:capsular polysaccharide biosynthesis protein